MTKFLIFVISFFEFTFYTLLMVLIKEIPVKSPFLELVIHFFSLITLGVIIYYLIKFILKKLHLELKKYLYIIPICNILLGTVILPLIMLIIAPKTLLSLIFISIIGTISYGLFINIVIILMNIFLTKN